MQRVRLWDRRRQKPRCAVRRSRETLPSPDLQGVRQGRPCSLRQRTRHLLGRVRGRASGHGSHASSTLTGYARSRMPGPLVPDNPVLRQLYGALAGLAWSCGAEFAFVIDVGKSLCCLALAALADSEPTLGTLLRIAHESRAIDSFYKVEMVPRIAVAAPGWSARRREARRRGPVRRHVVRWNLRSRRLARESKRPYAPGHRSRARSRDSPPRVAQD
jgi:hypothetical protein